MNESQQFKMGGMKSQGHHTICCVTDCYVIVNWINR